VRLLNRFIVVFNLVAMVITTWAFHIAANNETVLNLGVVFSNPTSARNKCTTISLSS
jgi:hypothetical protein